MQTGHGEKAVLFEGKEKGKDFRQAKENEGAVWGAVVVFHIYVHTYV